MKKSIFKTVLVAFTFLISTASFAQSTRLYSTQPAPTRSPARYTNNLQIHVGSGVLVAPSSIGYAEGANSLGTTIPSDSSAFFYVYGNLNALGGVSYKYKVDSIQVYTMTSYENFINVKLLPGSGNDTILLPAATAGKIVTIKNSTLATIYVKGRLRTEYIDTLVTYSIAKKGTLNLCGTGLTSPTGTVVATNKLNPSWIVR